MATRLEAKLDTDDMLWIATLTVSSLHLFRDQRFRGYCILSFDLWKATSMDSLSDEEYRQFFLDLRIASRAVRTALKPDHMNYELLGNSNPHLHWHIVPRYKTDPRWGQPIWEGWQRGEFWINRYALSDIQYHDMIDLIRRTLDARDA